MKRNFGNIFGIKPRATKMRSAVLAILKERGLPLAEPEIMEALIQRGIRVNKTSVYRAIQFFEENKTVLPIDFGDGKKRYEMNSGGHHHHLICTSCKKVDEVHMEDNISRIEQKINKRKNFTVMRHSLEFFGLCKNCVKN